MQQSDEQFIEKMGLFFEADGAPRISGRMLGLLLLTPGECSLDDIAERLQVSKGSVSTNARMLEGWGVIDRVSRPGDRRDYYRIAKDAQSRILERRLKRMRLLQELIEEGQRTLTITDEEVRGRLERIHEFHVHCVAGMSEGLRQLRSGETSRSTSDVE